MKIEGKVWKSRTDSFWLAEVPFLDILTQAETKEETPAMVKDAIELYVNDPTYFVDVTLINNQLLIDSNDSRKLIALALKRQRQKNKLKLSDVTEHLGAKSINEYAQYEQGKHLPSLEKLEELLRAIDPRLQPYLGIGKTSQ